VCPGKPHFGGFYWVAEKSGHMKAGSE